MDLIMEEMKAETAARDKGRGGRGGKGGGQIDSFMDEMKTRQARGDMSGGNMMMGGQGNGGGGGGGGGGMMGGKGGKGGGGFMMQGGRRQGGSHDDGNPHSTNLYLGNLAPTTTEEELLRIFGKYGPIASVKVQLDQI